MAIIMGVFFNQRGVSQLETRIDARFNSMETRFNNIDARFDSLHRDMGEFYQLRPQQ